MYLLLLFLIRNINIMSKVNALAPNRCKPLPFTVMTSRQRSCNQRVGCLICSVVRIYEKDGWISGQILDIWNDWQDIQQFYFLYQNKKISFNKQIKARVLQFLVPQQLVGNTSCILITDLQIMHRYMDLWTDIFNYRVE